MTNGFRQAVVKGGVVTVRVAGDSVSMLSGRTNKQLTKVFVDAQTTNTITAEQIAMRSQVPGA